MTNEEKELLVANLVDNSERCPDVDAVDQFMDWYQIRCEARSSRSCRRWVKSRSAVRRTGTWWVRLPSATLGHFSVGVDNAAHSPIQQPVTLHMGTPRPFLGLLRRRE